MSQDKDGYSRFRLRNEEGVYIVVQLGEVSLLGAPTICWHTLEWFLFSYSDTKHLNTYANIFLRSFAGSTSAMHYIEKDLPIRFHCCSPWGYSYSKPRCSSLCSTIGVDCDCELFRPNILCSEAEWLLRMDRSTGWMWLIIINGRCETVVKIRLTLRLHVYIS